MKNLFLVVLLIAFSSTHSQITLTNVTFPAAGDTLKYAIDNSPTINFSLAPGGDQIWDFTGLKKQFTYKTIYQNATSGGNLDQFPGADLVVIENNSEIYYNLTNSKFETVGRYGLLEGIPIGELVVSTYQPAVIERHAPFNFFDINQQSSNQTIAFSASVLTDPIWASLPIKPDSIRIRMSLQRIEVVDGWGTCMIPGGDYPVLRAKLSEYKTTNIDVKVGILGWIDLSAVIGGGGGNPLAKLIYTDTTVMYRFLNNTSKEEIAVVTLNNDQNAFTKVSFKDNFSNSLVNVIKNVPKIQAYPNPAIDWVKFDCTDIPSGNYLLKIYNSIGDVLWSQKKRIDDSISIPVDIRSLNNGIVFYSLSDERGNVVSAKQLFIAKPN